MQHRAAARGAVAVNRIAQNRPAHFRAMDPKLMRTPGHRFEREPSEGGIASHHLPPGHRRLALGIVLHPPAPRHVEPAERQVDDAFVRLGRAFDDGPIGLADLAVLEQLAELRQRLAVAAEHQAAGRVAVEPMRQRRRPRQPEAQRVEMVLQAHPAFRAVMNGKTRRLVDHQHQPIAVEQPRHHLFRGHVFRDHAETAITGAPCKTVQQTALPKRTETAEAAEAKGNWWQRLTGGLKRSSTALERDLGPRHQAQARRCDAR